MWGPCWDCWFLETSRFSARKKQDDAGDEKAKEKLSKSRGCRAAEVRGGLGLGM